MCGYGKRVIIVIKIMLDIESLVGKIEEEFLGGEVPVSADGLTPSVPTTDVSVLGDMPSGNDGYMSKDNNFMVPRAMLKTKRKKKKDIIEMEDSDNIIKELIEKIEELTVRVQVLEQKVAELEDQGE